MRSSLSALFRRKTPETGVTVDFEWLVSREADREQDFMVVFMDKSGLGQRPG